MMSLHSSQLWRWLNVSVYKNIKNTFENSELSLEHVVPCEIRLENLYLQKFELNCLNELQHQVLR